MAAVVTVRAIRTVAVEVPMARPLDISAQIMRTAQILLIDLETGEGITGHAYLTSRTRCEANAWRRSIVALSALRARLDGHAHQDILPSVPRPVPAAPRTKLPRLLDLSDMQAETTALVMALNGFGTRRSDAVLASMYRHLAHWPSYLSLAWLLLAPLDADGQLSAAIQQAERAALARADRLPVRLVGSAALPPALAAKISAATEPFVGDVIVKMLVIYAFLRRGTA